MLIEVYSQQENVIGIKNTFAVLNENSDSISWPSLILIDSSGSECPGDFQVTACLGLRKPGAPNLFSVEAAVCEEDEIWPNPLSDQWEYTTSFKIFDDFTEDLLGDINKFTSNPMERTETEVADIFIFRLALAGFGSRFNQIASRLSLQLQSCIFERFAFHARNEYRWHRDLGLTNLEQETVQRELRIMHKDLK